MKLKQISGEPSPDDKFTLELSRYELSVLLEVAGLVGGPPTASNRRVFDRFREVIQNNNIEPSCSLEHPSRGLYFKDDKNTGSHPR